MKKSKKEPKPFYCSKYIKLIDTKNRIYCDKDGNASGVRLLDRNKYDRDQITGDIRSLSQLTDLQEIDLKGTNVSGNISSLSGLNNLQYSF